MDEDLLDLALMKEATTFWLVKQEPADYPWARLAADRGTAWTGVRSFPARNHLRTMKAGDLVLFYHSGTGKEIVGVARVAKAAYPDPTAKEGDWSSIDLAPVRPLKHAVSLAVIKADAVLRAMPLVRQSRLSVMPVTPAQFARVLDLAQTKL
jgi:predicted RNA-binding protein with PUA-like domain